MGKITGYVSSIEEKTIEWKECGWEDLVENLEEKSPLGRSMCRWKGLLKWILKKVIQEGVSWIHLAHDTDHWLFKQGNKMLGIP
jgi:hypothetical protein